MRRPARSPRGAAAARACRRGPDRNASTMMATVTLQITVTVTLTVLVRPRPGPAGAGPPAKFPGRT